MLHGKYLSSLITFPSDKFRPEFNVVNASLEAPDLSIRLILPRWNTHAFYAAHRCTDIARIPVFKIVTTYIFYSTIQRNNLDELDVQIKVFGLFLLIH